MDRAVERVVACCWMPGFPLRVVAHGAGIGLDRPVALASDAEAHPVVLDCSEAARDDGVEPGMLVARAMGCCAALEVLACDVARVERAAERFLARLEALGAAVQPMEPGRAFFEVGPLELLYGGVEAVLERVLAAFRGGGVRIGTGPNPFVAWVAARRAVAGGWARIGAREVRDVLAPMPLELLPARPELIRLLRALGLEGLGDVAALDVHQMADRFGADGVRLRALAAGEDGSRIEPRVPAEPVVERLVFPEPVASEVTLGSAVELLASQLVQHPRCVAHAPRAVVLSCALTGGGSWRARRVLRVPSVDAGRLVLAIRPALGELPAAVERVELSLEGFAPRDAEQGSLVDAHERARGRVRRGALHVQEALGEDALLQVLEVEPWSRVPERHAVLVPMRGGRR